MSSSSSPRLNAINYLNAVAYVANVLFTYGFGVLGLGGGSTNAELSEKYQTLVTPAGWAFSIWSIIFLCELIFCILQLLPAFRAINLVQQGVGYKYVGVCAAQIGWTIFFSFELIVLSLVAMLTLLVFLLLIVIAQYKINSVTKDYWLFKFPFAIHAGWIVAASLVNINVVLVDLQVSSGVQLLFAVISLAIVLAAAALALFKPTPPEFVIPSVLIWATAAIGVELGNPKELIVNTFEEGTVRMIRIGAFSVSIAIALLVGFAAFRQWRSSRGSESGEETAYLRTDKNGKPSI